jgi:hypothetical protein
MTDVSTAQRAREAVDAALGHVEALRDALEGLNLRSRRNREWYLREVDEVGAQRREVRTDLELAVLAAYEVGAEYRDLMAPLGVTTPSAVGHVLTDARQELARRQQQARELRGELEDPTDPTERN